MERFNINPEFRDKIPPLSDDEFKRLEENIVNDGEVREPLIVWNNTLIDGHHRWQIIQKHPEIPYKVKEMDFPDKWGAISWMCSNQLGRRNVTDAQRTYLLGKLYEARKNTRGGDRGNQYTNVAKPAKQDLAKQKSTQTSYIIAKEHGIGHAAVEEAGEYAKGLDAAEEIKKQLNESYPVEGNSPYSLVLSNLDDVKKSFPKNAPSELIKEFNGLFGMVEELHDAYKNNKFLKFK